MCVDEAALLPQTGGGISFSDSPVQAPPMDSVRATRRPASGKYLDEQGMNFADLAGNGRLQVGRRRIARIEGPWPRSSSSSCFRPQAHERLRNRADTSFRLDAWRDTVRLATSSPWVRQCLGSFEDAYPRVKSGHGEIRVEHAENDGLEMLAEARLLLRGRAQGAATPRPERPRATRSTSTRNARTRGPRQRRSLSGGGLRRQHPLSPPPAPLLKFGWLVQRYPEGSPALTHVCGFSPPAFQR